MDPRLLQAAATGNVNSLGRLMKEDMLLLDTVALLGAETPLHVATMCGHLSFVQEMLKLKKQFAYELNQDGFSPLHLASAVGHLQIVLELLKLDPNLCAIQGREQRLPVHCAVVKGRIDVMKELLSARPDTVECKTARGETLFHLVVKNNQFDALKLLVEHVKVLKKEGILNEKDNQGNTVLHLAASRKQYEVVHLLLVGDDVSKEVVEVNWLNETGMSPLDVLMLFQSEAGDLEIHAVLVKAGAKRGKDISSSGRHNKENEVHTANTESVTTLEIIHDNQVPPTNPSTEPSSLPTRIRYWPRLEEMGQLFGYKPKRDSPMDARNILLTVAALMTTATYQAVFSPPGGQWQDDDGHTAGKSIMATKSAGAFWVFMVGNSIGFYTSLHMIGWLTIDFPLQYPLLLLTFCMSMNYTGSIISMVPDEAHLLVAVYLAIAFGLLAPLVPSVIRRLRFRPRA